MAHLILAYKQGTGAISPSHRFWRLLLTDLNGISRWIVPEIEMAETVSAPTVTTTGFAIASSSKAPETPADAFDTVNAVSGGAYWEPAATQIGEWIGQDFGAGNEKTIVEVRISESISFPMPYMDMQYSDNGVDWTTVVSITSTVPGWNNFSW